MESIEAVFRYLRFGKIISTHYRKFYGRYKTISVYILYRTLDDIEIFMALEKRNINSITMDSITFSHHYQTPYKLYKFIKEVEQNMKNG